MPTPGDGPESLASEEDWSAVVAFVGRVADLLGASGWSLGIRRGDSIQTVTHGFPASTCAAFAEISLEAALPGPHTLRTGEDHFFPSRREAHRVFPAAAAIDAGTRHDAAATLALRSADASGPPIGYLAVHFAGEQELGEREVERLRRVARSVEPLLQGLDGTGVQDTDPAGQRPG